MTIHSDTVQTDVAVNIITGLFSACARGLLEAGRWIAKTHKRNDFLGLAARKYAQNLEQLHNSIRIPGMDKPTPLRTLFVNVNVLDKITERQHTTIQALAAR